MNYVTTPVPHTVRKIEIDNTMERMYHKPRSMIVYDPEDFFKERCVTAFENESKAIRANTAALLKMAHTPIPRSIRPQPINDHYDYEYIETPITDRILSIW